VKIVHTIPDIDKEAAGPTYSVVRLCDALREEGEEVTLALVGERPSSGTMRVFARGWGPKRFGNSPAMNKWLHAQVTAGVDVVHNHSLWMLPNVYAGWATRGKSTTYIVSPRGTLSPTAMASGSRLKRIIWPLLQRPALSHANCFHATAESEYEDIRRVGFRQPVAVIPNGIDIPTLVKRHATSRRTVLYLGRLHPIKGVDLLLRAWQTLQARYPAWDLRIVGPRESPTAASLIGMASSLGLRRISFDGALYGSDKFRAYQDASLYVLPSHSENFAMTVAEALASGTPVVVSQGAPWERVKREHAGWWHPTGYDGLCTSLEQAMSMPHDALIEMGQNGRRWMQKEFSWNRIAREMQDTYRWMRNQGPKPTCVRVE
jgi:glycosyltransferase involved in cell wall biosynthesis